MKKHILMISLMLSFFCLRGMEPLHPDTNITNEKQRTHALSCLEECAICLEPTQSRTPCCKQATCLSCWNTPIKYGDIEFQDVAGEQSVVVPNSHQSCAICRTIKASQIQTPATQSASANWQERFLDDGMTDEDFAQLNIENQSNIKDNGLNHRNANLVSRININNDNNASPAKPIRIPLAQQRALRETKIEVQDEIDQTIQLTIANQSAKIISAFLATNKNGFLKPELIASGSFAGPLDIVKNGRSFFTTRRGTFALAPDNVVNPTMLNLTHLEESRDEGLNRVVQQFPYKLLKGLMLLIGNDDSISGLQQQTQSNQLEEASHSRIAQDYSPLPSLSEVVSTNGGMYIDAQDGTEKSNNNDYETKSLNLSNEDTIKYDRDGKSPLLWAVLQEDEDAALRLLESGAYPNIIYNDQKLVHYAIKRKLFRIVTAMLKHGVDFSGVVENNKDIFTYVSSLEIIPKQPATVSRRGRQRSNIPIKQTPMVDNKVVFDLLFELINCGYDLQRNLCDNNLENNAWCYAIQNHQSNHILFFLGKYPGYKLDAPANPSQPLPCQSSDRTSLRPLLLAINCYENVPQMMPGGPLNIIANLSNAVTINELCNTPRGPITPLSAALLKYDDYNLITYLISEGGNLALALQYYLRDGGRVDKLFGGYSILEISINCSDIRAVEYLIKAGANINLFRKDIHGQYIMPLKIAFQKNNADIIALLIKNGAKMEYET
jgi:ankyrin repeat protein